jgi:hypothetical protein
MDVYAIRHKPSGEFMPVRMSRTSRGGWSYWREPGNTPYDATPRLFPTKQGAINALSSWMQGRWVHEYTGGSFECPDDGYYETVPEEPKSPRVREGMEIVELALTGPGLAE